MREVIKSTYPTECILMKEAPSNKLTLHMLVEQEVKALLMRTHSCKSFQVYAACDLFNPTFVGSVCGTPVEGTYKIANGRLIIKVTAFVAIER